MILEAALIEVSIRVAMIVVVIPSLGRFRTIPMLPNRTNTNVIVVKIDHEGSIYSFQRMSRSIVVSIDAFESVDDISEKVRKSSSIGTIVACLWRKLCVLYTHTLASML